MFGLKLTSNQGFSMILQILVYLLLPAIGMAAYPPLPTALPPPGEAPLIVTDENNHALAVYADADTGNLLTYYFSNNVWTSIPFPVVTVLGLSVDMEPMGTAIAQIDDGAAITTYSFDGTSWMALSPNPLAINNSFGGGIALLSPGQGLTSWIDSGSNVIASFLTGNAWGIPTTLGVGISDVVAYSANGTAIISMESSGDVYASYYNGSSWSVVPALVASDASLLSLGIDANGNGLALMSDSTTGDLTASNFNGSIWLPPVIVGPAPDLAFSEQPLAMSANGSAVAVWQRNNSGLSIYDNYYSIFNGTTWSTPILFQSGVDGSEPAVAIDDTGNSLIIYGLNSPPEAQIVVGQLPSGGVLTTQVVYNRGPDTNFPYVSISLSSNGFSAIGWAETVGGSDTLNPFVAAVTLGSPTDGSFSSCKNKFAMQTDIVNVISFVPSTDFAVASYYIRRNGVLIAIIPAFGPYVYQDGNRVKGQTDVYTIVSVGADGQESLPLMITVNQ